MKYLTECIETGWISSDGPFVKEFENKFSSYIGTKYGISVCNGTAALETAFFAAGVGKGDEVIMPNRTWVATANAPMILGAKPVLVDVVKRAPLIDPGKIEEKITKKTRIILPVHLNGRGSDMEVINKT